MFYLLFLFSLQKIMTNNLVFNEEIKSYDLNKLFKMFLIVKLRKSGGQNFELGLYLENF